MSRIAEAVRLPLSIATILTISMVGIIALLMIVLTVVEIRRERAFFRNDQQERGELLVGGLGETLANYIYFNDVDALRDLSSRVLNSRTDVDYIQMWRFDGSLLTASTKANSRKDYPTVLAAERFGFESAQGGITTRRFQGNRLQVTSPISAGPDVVGIIQFGFNSDALDAQMRSIVIQNIWQALVLIAIGIVLSYLMARYASKPLRELAAAATEIGRGNLDAVVPIRGARETAELGTSFDGMRTELIGLYLDLEWEVAERTEELTVIYLISRILSQSGSFESRTNKVMERLAESTGAELVTLRQERNGEPGLHLVAAAGPAVTTSPPIPVLSNTESLPFKALREGDPIVANDYPSEPNASPELVAQGMKSMVLMPIKAADRTVGLVNVVSTQTDHFSRELVRLLTMVGAALGSLLENAQLDRDLEANREEMAAVDQVARIITSNLEIGQVYEQFFSEVRLLVDFDRAAVNVIDADRDTIQLQYHTGSTNARYNQGDTIPREDTISWHVAYQRSTLIIEDLAEDTRFPATESLLQGLRSVIATPLISKEEVIGMLLLFSRQPNAYGGNDMVILERLAAQIAPAVENNFLFQRVERLSLALESIGDSVCFVDPDGTIQFVNSAFEEQYGYTSDQVVGSHINILAPAKPDNDDRNREIIDSARNRVWIGETERVRKNGEEFQVRLTVAPVKDHTGEVLGFVGVDQDLTEQKRAEAERRAMEVRALAQSKLATLGEVATGVAHEINQPLTYISAMIQSLQEDMRLNDLDMQRGQAQLAESIRQVARITSIVDHLRTFGRREDTEMAEVNLSEILDSSSLLIGQRIRLRDIELERRIDEDLPPVWGNASQLEQVFINLFQNSIDALAETQQAKITVAIHSSLSQGQVALSFSDNGVGIPPAYVEKVFEPFFTTKPAGEGTGLGLSIIYGIVMDHHGKIACESEYTIGTTITITLPIMV